MTLRTLSILDMVGPDAPRSVAETTGAAGMLYEPSVLRALADLRARAVTLTWATADPELVVPLQPDAISLR